MISSRCFVILVSFTIVQNGNCDSVSKTSFGTLENTTANLRNDGTTTETHYTTCKITTEQLVADARATFTRVLTGACNSKIINDRFEKLERLLNERFNEMRELIVRSSMTIKRDLNVPETSLDSRDIEERLFSEKNHLPANLIDEDAAEMKFLDENGKEEYFLMTSRWDEIERYNNSVQHTVKFPSSSSNGVNERIKVYTYYWRVLNLMEKLLKWKTGRSERSSTFYAGIDGYAMYMRFTPKYFPDGTIFISVGITSGENDSKITWPFPLKLRIEILDLATMLNGNVRPKDRSSRLWDPATVCSSYFWGRPSSSGTRNVQRTTSKGRIFDNPECVGISIHRHLLMNVDFVQTAFTTATSTGKYVSNNSLLVKLTVYL